MKYRVTEKHPYLKEGIIIENIDESADHGYSVYQLGSEQELLGCNMHIDWLKDDWLEEIQKAEFTKDDMIRFAKWCDEGEFSHGTEAYEKALNDWKK